MYEKYKMKVFILKWFDENREAGNSNCSEEKNIMAIITQLKDYWPKIIKYIQKFCFEQITYSHITLL